MIRDEETLLAELVGGTLVEHRHENVELKESWKHEDGKKVAALANKNLDVPCWVVVGVNDQGLLAGKDEKWARQSQQVISQHFNAALDPSLACQGITCHPLAGAWAILVRFANPGCLVYWNSRAYKMAGTTIAELEPKEAMELMITQPGLSDYSAQELSSTPDSGLIKSFSDRLASLRSEDIYVTLPKLEPEEALARIGVANRQVARILFGDLSWRVVKYDRGGDPCEDNTFHGAYGLLDTSFQTHLQDWTRQQARIESLPYPDRVLREALANAVAHAAYYENDGELLIELFSDRLCISNLSLPESRYFANRWFSRSRKTFNRSLVETLRLAGLVEELGRGKHLIFTGSLKAGKRPPEVTIEGAGRLDRWRLTVYGGTTDRRQLRLLKQLRDHYKDEAKALVANALIAWRHKPVREIREYVDGESRQLFVDVLEEAGGPVFYYAKEDRLILTRWVEVLLGEGKDSKALSPAEEERLRHLASEIHIKYHGGVITPKSLRELGGLGHSSSAQVLSSQLLSKWLAEGYVKRAKRGSYQFLPKRNVASDELLRRLWQAFGAKPGSGT